MIDDDKGPVKAYKDEIFLASPDARGLRILSEYIEPQARLNRHDIKDTIIFFGSARTLPKDVAEQNLETTRTKGADTKKAELDVSMSQYYEAARDLSGKMTDWSKQLEDRKKRFIVCTGGGPGIMEAANRGACEAGGLNIGFNISLPMEQHENPYVTRELSFEFHYFFMRKFWFAYLAKAIVVFPGGFGTMDEFFEILTLIQTKKITKPLPIVLYGKDFWSRVLNLNALAEFGTISEEDLSLFHICDDVDEAFDYMTEKLKTTVLADTGKD